MRKTARSLPNTYWYWNRLSINQAEKLLRLDNKLSWGYKFEGTWQRLSKSRAPDWDPTVDGEGRQDWWMQRCVRILGSQRSVECSLGVSTTSTLSHQMSHQSHRQGSLHRNPSSWNKSTAKHNHLYWIVAKGCKRHLRHLQQKIQKLRNDMKWLELLGIWWLRIGWWILHLRKHRHCASSSDPCTARPREYKQMDKNGNRILMIPGRSRIKTICKLLSLLSLLSPRLRLKHSSQTIRNLWRMNTV